MVSVDPDNPVIKLCTEGMRAETEGRPDDARALFEQAWDAAGDDYEACVAAHYLARHQPTPELTLHWNRVCLTRADLVGDGRVKGFRTSLHLNMAKAHPDPDRAREHYTLAAAHLSDVPPGPYADATRMSIADGFRSTGVTGPRPVEPLLVNLFTRLRALGDLKALALLLPVYLTDLGTEEDRLRLLAALGMVHAARWLPDDEQAILGQVIGALTQT
ncbi:hypothetical protein [Umezawaea sp. Da 62-37]|uniref:hypothetical protein n=1 Tax=Umezawaea sp. Da 62-37 TaxID=3075927 RepID=UPI0028F6D0BD|nr:hypothetical protein [Umezawaea sp. Da 62-37]WNV86634.1 hypothetical protein RM788_52405 [Umezawaea sp. Da 62-37]